MKSLGPTFRIAAAGTVLCLTLGVTSASGAAAISDRTPPGPTPGYWLAGDDGGVFAFNAPSTARLHPTALPTVRILRVPPSPITAAPRCSDPDRVGILDRGRDPSYRPPSVPQRLGRPGGPPH